MGANSILQTSTCVALFRILLLVLASLTLPQLEIAAQTLPGLRSNACAFAYNNTFYLLGGVSNSSQPPFIFVSTPLPITTNATALNWTSLSTPSNWVPMIAADAAPQFHRACTKDGRVFLFGNSIGFASYNISIDIWDPHGPTFQTAGLSVNNNLLNQAGLRAALHPDGYTISIVSTSSASSVPTYMVFNSRSGFIKGVALQNVPLNLQGFCLTVVPKNSQPVMCGGSVLNSFKRECYLLSLTGIPAWNFVSLLYQQDGCSLVGFDNSFLLIPGRVSLNQTSLSSISPSFNMTIYDMQSYVPQLIPNSQNISYPGRAFAASAFIPGSNAAVIYGGAGDTLSTSETNGDLNIFSFANNSWISGLDFSPNSTVYLPTKAPSTSKSTPTPTQANGSSTKLGLSTGAIAGIATAVIAFVIIAVAIFNLVRYCKRRRERRLDSCQDNVPLSPGKSNFEVVQTGDRQASQNPRQPQSNSPETMSVHNTYQTSWNPEQQSDLPGTSSANTIDQNSSSFGQSFNSPGARSTYSTEQNQHHGSIGSPPDWRGLASAENY